MFFFFLQILVKRTFSSILLILVRSGKNICSLFVCGQAGPMVVSVCIVQKNI